MTAKINLRQFVIFIKPRYFDTADIKYFTVFSPFQQRKTKYDFQFINSDSKTFQKGVYSSKNDLF